MKRTQLYLSETLMHKLAQLSRQSHKTISALVREGLEWVYIKPTPAKTLQGIQGLWADRKGFSTDRFIRHLRQDRHRRKHRPA